MFTKTFSIFNSLIVTFLTPILIVTSVASFVINLPLLYEYGFDRYDISEYTGIEKSELMSAASLKLDPCRNSSAMRPQTDHDCL